MEKPCLLQHYKRIRPTFRREQDLVLNFTVTGSEYFASWKLRFGEDLTTKDKETRNRLWPHINAARKEGKKAFFVRAKALIDGRELKVEGMKVSGMSTMN